MRIVISYKKRFLRVNRLRISALRHHFSIDLDIDPSGCVLYGTIVEEELVNFVDEWEALDDGACFEALLSL